MVYLDTMPLRFGHFRVLITTAMGQFLGAAVATLSGVLIPLLAIVQHHELDSVTQWSDCQYGADRDYGRSFVSESLPIRTDIFRSFD